MKLGSKILLIGMGVGGTLLYQQMISGNIEKMMKSAKKITKRTLDDLEDMM